MEFKLRDGTKVKKEFMTKKSSHFKYLETELLRMVRIPYKEAGCYMVVAIPKDENKYIGKCSQCFQLNSKEALRFSQAGLGFIML